VCVCSVGEKARARKADTRGFQDDLNLQGFVIWIFRQAFFLPAESGDPVYLYKVSTNAGGVDGVGRC
jgi:hypothetical protein